MKQIEQFNYRIKANKESTIAEEDIVRILADIVDKLRNVIEWTNEQIEKDSMPT